MRVGASILHYRNVTRKELSVRSAYWDGYIKKWLDDAGYSHSVFDEVECYVHERCESISWVWLHLIRSNGSVVGV